MQNSFYIENKQRVQTDFNKLLKTYPKLTGEAIIAYSMDLVNYVKGKIKGDKHIVTGRLLRSIHWETSNSNSAESGNDRFAAVPKEGEVYVGTNVNYADYVDKSVPAGYTTNALDQGLRKVSITKSIDRYLSQKGKRAL